MDYPIALPDQLTHHLRSLRKVRGLNQAQLASHLGVTQSRVATIERNPAVVSMGQLLHILNMLGSTLVLRDLASTPTPTPRAQSPAPDATTQPSDDLPAGEW